MFKFNKTSFCHSYKTFSALPQDFFLGITHTHTHTPVTPIRSHFCLLLVTPLVFSDDIRQEVRRRTTNRLCQSTAVNLLGYGAVVWGVDGVTGVVREGHLVSCLLTSAPAVPLVRSNCMINGHSLQISRRVCGAEESQRRKHRNGKKRGGNCVWRKNTTLCHSFTARVMTKWLSVVIRPYGLCCLAASSGKVMIASETEEVN